MTRPALPATRAVRPPAAGSWALRMLQALAFFGLAVAALGAARAEDDPPGRVGWVSIADGNVTLEDVDQRETVEEPRNWPLSSGDALTTGWGARAEVHIGSTRLRLDADTRLVFNRIDDEAVQVTLERGRAALHVVSPEVAREVELYASGSRFVPVGPGLFRIDLEGRDRLSASALQGRLRYDTPDVDLTVREGQRVDIEEGPRGSWRYGPIERDGFAQWAGEMTELPAPRMGPRGEPVGVPIGAAPAGPGQAVGVPVSPEMTGVAELHRHGVWENSPEYGTIWYPSVVAVDWAPYRYGRWAWVRPWGWTWIDAAPWGFAPFHYGRWVWWRNRWGWVPGTYVARPVYAPALVGWVGSPGVSVSVSVGPPVGWFPLAPREVYVPVYRCTPRYVQAVNVTHVTRITDVHLIIGQPQRAVERYRYRYYHDDPRAVSALPVDAWRERRPTARPVPARDIGWEPRPSYDRREPYRRDRDRDGFGDGPRIIAAPILGPGIRREPEPRRAPIAPPVVIPRPPMSERPAPGWREDNRGDDRGRPGQPAPRIQPAPRDDDPPRRIRPIEKDLPRPAPPQPAPQPPRVDVIPPPRAVPAQPVPAQPVPRVREDNRPRPAPGDVRRRGEGEPGNGKDDDRRRLLLKRNPSQAPE